MLSVLSLFCLFLCDFYLICSALVFHEWWKDIGMKALTNFPSILHDGNCTNIVFVEDLRHQESFDAIRHMFLNVMTEEAYINYLMYITIRYSIKMFLKPVWIQVLKTSLLITVISNLILISDVHLHQEVTI